jgi:hypothetical protein
MSVGLVGVLVGAVLGRWAPLAGDGNTLTPDRYAALPTAYFQSLAASSSAPMDQFGYATASGSTSSAETAVSAGGGLPATPVAIYDSAANVAAALDQLQLLFAAGKLASITFMETTTPVVRLTVQQFADDFGALSKASATYRLDIAADTNAAYAVSLADSALSFIGTPDVIVLGGPATTVHYNLTAASGIETIANFRYGTDRLDIEMESLSASDLVANDTILAGKKAITIHAGTDVNHGVVLVDIASVATSSNLLSQHIMITGGHAFIS